MLKIAALRAVPAFATHLGGIVHSLALNQGPLQIGTYSMVISCLSMRVAAARFAWFDPAILSLVFGLLVRLLYPSINPDIAETCAWKVFLPVSLSLGIMGAASDKQQDDAGSSSLKSVLLAFLFGTIGSLAGASVNILVSKLFMSSEQSFMEVSKLATCLSASYIGGTANFFETAAALQLQARQQLRLLAVADIGVMAVYFSILQAVYRRLSGTQEKKVDTSNAIMTSEVKPEQEHAFVKYTSYIISSCLAVMITVMSNHVQSIYSHFPGLAVLWVTLLSAAAAVLPLTIMKNIPNLHINRNGGLSPLMRKSSGIWLGMFYAALGMALRPSDLLSLHPSSAVLFPVILTCHLSVLLSLSWLYEVKDMAAVLVASNACVGGSATAASMALLFGRDDLVLPGCIAGVLGYAIGTPLSLALYGLMVK